VLSWLYGLFADAGSSWDQFKIESWIKDENKRRDAAFELQKKLVEAEISLIYARAAALDKGEAMIQIDGAGLQPHLEGFMWEILRTIQTRVNQDGLEFLLGVE